MYVFNLDGAGVSGRRSGPGGHECTDDGGRPTGYVPVRASGRRPGVASGGVTFDVHPATLDRFDDVAAVIGPRRPDASVCFCLSHRLDTRTNRSMLGPARAEFVRGLCARDVSPGVLAYDGDVVVGWAAVAPRSELPYARSRTIPHVDDLPVWSVWCFRVRPGHRGRGVVHALLGGAYDFAVGHGAPAVEGYPVDNAGEKVDLTMAYVGTRAVFEAAGFRVAAPTTSVVGGFPRVVMRRS